MNDGREKGCYMSDPTRFVALLSDENGDDFEAEVVLATAFDEAVEVVQGMSAAINARDMAWAEADAAARRADYWKAEHLAGNAKIDALAAQCLELRERVAFLESREVCTVAHDNVETCGYCQRDAAEARLAQAEDWLREMVGELLDSGKPTVAGLIEGFLRTAGSADAAQEAK